MDKPSQLDNKPSRKKQWLWFIALYVISVLAIGLFAGLLKLLIPH